MSHGRRMLEAQAQKQRTSGTRDDGRVDDGHLRNGTRALNDDGTPVRRSSHHRLSGRAGDSVEEGDSTPRKAEERGEERLPKESTTLLASPPPRPGVKLGTESGNRKSRSRGGGGSGGDARRSATGSSSSGAGLGVPDFARLHLINAGVAPPPPSSSRAASSASAAPLPLSVATTASTAPQAASALSNEPRDGTRTANQAETQTTAPRIGGAARHIEVSSDMESDEEEHSRQAAPPRAEVQQETRGEKRSRNEVLPMKSSVKERSHQPSASRSEGQRYPAERIQLQRAPATTPEAALRVPASDLSPAPPPLPQTSDASSSASSPEHRSNTRSCSPPSVTLAQTRTRAAPPPMPVTAALQLTSSVASASPGLSDDAHGHQHAAAAHRPPPLRPDAPAIPLSPSTPASGMPAFISRGGSSLSIAAVLLPSSPASPPLRAGVSPRMMPRHPTRTDAGTAAASAANTHTSSYASRSRAASAASNPIGPSPSSSQVQPPLLGAQVSPYDLPSAPTCWVAMTPPTASTPTSSNAVSTRAEGPAGKEEGRAGQSDRDDDVEEGITGPSLPQADEPAKVVLVGRSHSPPPSPLPPTQYPTVFPSRTLSPPSAALSAAAGMPSEAPNDIRASPQPSPTLACDLPPPAREPDYTSPTFMPSLLTNSPDVRHYPYMRDYSGFHNAGNDCYGCSALTMLLRSLVFRRALLFSPVVAAARRYEALLTGRQERRVQWASGYVLPSPSAVAKAKAAAKKRARGVGSSDGDEVTVGDVCGLTPPLASSRFPLAVENDTTAMSDAHLTEPVKRTLDLLSTFALEDLEDVLEVDLETERVPMTLHSALATLARSQRWREHICATVNAPATRPADRERILDDKVFHDNDRTFAGQVYMNGIRLTGVASLFDGEFFLGDQEDAHELFVALMARLESEAVGFQRRCAEVVGRRAPQQPRQQQEKEEEDDEEHTEAAEEEVLHPSTAMSARSSPVQKPNASMSVSTAVADVWINALVQTRLLNIIRCRSPGCQHEIVTDEIFVNLSLHIPENEKENAEGSGGVSAVRAVPAAPPRAGCSVGSLLHASTAYEALNDYKCDACGSTSSQYQGGCFYGRPPPVLVLQLKRFLTTFVNGTFLIQKNGRPVAVEDMLVVYALPTAEELKAQQQRRATMRTVHRRDVQRECATHAEGATEAEEDSSMDEEVLHECCLYYDADKKRFASSLQTCEGDGDTDKSSAIPDRRTATKDGDGGKDSDDGETEAFSSNHSATPSSMQQAATSMADRGIRESDRICAVRTVYRLRSYVLHLGQSLHYGHYVSDFAVEGEPTDTEEDDEEFDIDGTATDEEKRRDDGLVAGEMPHASQHRCWRRANDERVEVLAQAAVRARRAGRSDMYLLLYEKVAEEWVRCPVDAVLPRAVYPEAEAEVTER